MKKMTVIAIVLMLISMLFGGVTALGTGSTISGMQAAVQGAPGSFLMTDGNLVMLAWPKGAEYAFAVLRTSDASPVNAFLSLAKNGQATDTFSMSDLVKCLEGYGWKYLTPAALPASITAKLVGWQGWLAYFRPGVINVIVVPAVVPYSPFQMTEG